MSNRKKLTTAIVAIGVLLAICGVVFAATRTEEPAQESVQQPSVSSSATSTEPKPSTSTKRVDNPDTPVSSEAEVTSKPGRYTSYSQAKLSEAGYDANIVFFFAPWCPECRAFKEAIAAGSIPTGVQVLEVDFDSSTDLKKQYGVTLQSTFVRVDDGGSLQKKWVGYGKEKSIESVLNNV